jgi:hypothetical protein
MLGSAPKDQADTAGAAPITAQRIGTALFGSGSGHSGSAKLMPSLTPTAR